MKMVLLTKEIPRLQLMYLVFVNHAQFLINKAKITHWFKMENFQY